MNTLTANALLVVSLSLCSSAAFAKNVIIFIGDGMGPSQVEAARLYLGEALSFESLPYQALCTTHSANNPVTDSAAAATALATGFKVNNDVISLAYPGDGSELQTLLEYYDGRGKRTGLITTAYLTHATPAAFGAHEPSRNNYSQITRDYLTQTRPNVLFGGGGNGLTLTDTANAGYVVATDNTGFWEAGFVGTHISAQFGTDHLPYEADYLDGSYPYPHLSQMVFKALEELETHPEGFFLMVEAGRIDHACHENNLVRSVHEAVELSYAVELALLWAAERTDTLILVTADHETGGLTVLQDNGPGTYPTVTWSTTGHTATDVPVYAWGKDAELITGLLDNTGIFAICTADETPNTPPTADNQSIETPEDTSLSITLSGLDADDDSLTFAILDPPSHGTLDGTPPNVNYQPEPNYNGMDTFTFLVFDAEDSSSPATVAITIMPVNDPPTPPSNLAAIPGSARVTLDWTAGIDPDEDPVTYSVYRGDLGDALIVGLTDTTYTDTGVQNEVSYEYFVRATDGSLTVDSEMVVVVPFAAAYNAHVLGNPAMSQGAVSGDYTLLREADGFAQYLTEGPRGNAALLDAEYLLQTTANAAEINSLTLHLVTLASSWDDPWQMFLWNGADWENITTAILGGSITPAGDPRNYVAADGTIRVRFSDGGAVRKEQADQLSIDNLFAEITIGPAMNRNPVAQNDAATTSPGSPVTITVLTNDHDPDGDSLNLAGVTQPPGGGSVELNGDQTLTCTPEADFTGNIEFTYTIDDGNGGSAIGNVTVFVSSGLQLVYVQSISMGLSSAGKNWKATADVLIQDQDAQPAAGAIVLGDWFYNGFLVQAGSQGSTDITGTLLLTSPPEKARPGDLFEWVVTGISLPGHDYAPEMNVVSSGSIAK